MDITIKNFYLIDKNDSEQFVKGTLHITIKIDEVELNIRGIFVTRKSGRWFFKMPYKFAINDKTNEKVSYPVIIFEKKEHCKKVMNFLYEKGSTFIETFLTNNPQLITQSVANKPKIQTKKENTNSNLKMRKKPISPMRQQIIKPIEWKDPPARKQNLRAYAKR